MKGTLSVDYLFRTYGCKPKDKTVDESKDCMTLVQKKHYTTLEKLKTAVRYEYDWLSHV